MSFRSRVQTFQEQLPSYEEIDQVRHLLREQRLELTIGLTSAGFSAVTWHVLQRQVSGVLKIAVDVAIADQSNPLNILTDTGYIPVQLNAPDKIEEEKLFDILLSAVGKGLYKMQFREWSLL